MITSTTASTVSYLGLACGFPIVPHGPAKPFSSSGRLRLNRFGRAADTAVPVQPQNAAGPFWGMNFSGSVWDRHGGGCPQAKRSYMQWPADRIISFSSEEGGEYP